MISLCMKFIFQAWDFETQFLIRYSFVKINEGLCKSYDFESKRTSLIDFDWELRENLWKKFKITTRFKPFWIETN